MNRGKVLISALFMLTGTIMAGQDFHFSQFMPTMVHVNPGYASLPASPEAGLVYRNQWPGISATFVTYGADLVVPVSSWNSGFGMGFTNDVQGGGVISQAAATLQYSYLIKLDRNWQVGAGLSASWVIRHFDASQLLFRSDILNDLGYSYGNTNFASYDRSYPDFSVGFIARHDGFLTFGVSASHLTRPSNTESSLYGARLPLKYTAFVSGVVGGNNRYSDFTLEPAVYFSKQQNNNEIIWGTNVNMAEKFLIGGWFRNSTSLSMDAFIVSAGISWEKYNIIYSYDVNLKKFNSLSTKLAAHEVTFLYRFKYNDQHKVKRFRKSECPAY
ncbi:MAG TPA: PorP/SprF family type IX secretion system membrane protein [Bacteroidales bacterium]|nr:PorP/SprF family type IX secretion system membrane protein [Bacteroidales bacterium]